MRVRELHDVTDMLAVLAEAEAEAFAGIGLPPAEARKARGRGRRGAEAARWLRITQRVHKARPTVEELDSSVPFPLT